MPLFGLPKKVEVVGPWVKARQRNRFWTRLPRSGRGCGGWFISGKVDRRQPLFELRRPAEAVAGQRDRAALGSAWRTGRAARRAGQTGAGKGNGTFLDRYRLTRSRTARQWNRTRAAPPERGGCQPL